MSSDEIHISGTPYFPGIARGCLERDAKQATESSIVLLTQAEVGKFRQAVAGILVIDGAPFSHAMIGLLTAGRPIVLISQEQAAQLEAGTELLIDGDRGLVTKQLGAASTQTGPTAVPRAGQPVFLADGVPVKLCASVRSVDAVELAVANGAFEIGLVRSEFLTPSGGGLPDAGFYLRNFRRISEAAAGLAINLRLLDSAADKMPSWLPPAARSEPLGLNGVRLYRFPIVWQAVEAQLQAISELSSEYELRVMLPFITAAEEFTGWHDRVRRQLPGHVDVGLIAETPASVLEIDRLLEQADFVAIGCNDLMQHLYAANRDTPALRDYLNPYAPVLFRMFKQVAETAGEQVHTIQLCGLLACIPGVLPVLVGLGYRKFSVDAAIIPYLANTVMTNTLSQCKTLAQHVCEARSAREVMEMLIKGDGSI